MNEKQILKNKLQTLVNEYVRKRDTKNGYARCISCGKIITGSDIQAGHFYSVGHFDGLRFNTDNIHAQCIKCNYYLHGNLINYRKNLINKIGIKRVEELDMKADYYKKHGHRWEVYELKLMINEFKQKLKDF